MADLVAAVAEYLQSRGLLTWDSDGITGNTFAEFMPSLPDEAIAITPYGLGEPDPVAADDELGLQVRVRGGPDPRVSRQLSMAIYSVLHGAAGLVLPDGTWLISAVALQTPSSLGVDENNRHEHVTNYRLNVSSATERRS